MAGLSGINGININVLGPSWKLPFFGPALSPAPVIMSASASSGFDGRFNQFLARHQRKKARHNEAKIKENMQTSSDRYIEVIRSNASSTPPPPFEWYGQSRKRHSSDRIGDVKGKLLGESSPRMALSEWPPSFAHIFFVIRLIHLRIVHEVALSSR